MWKDFREMEDGAQLILIGIPLILLFTFIVGLN